MENGKLRAEKEALPSGMIFPIRSTVFSLLLCLGFQAQAQDSTLVGQWEELSQRVVRPGVEDVIVTKTGLKENIIFKANNRYKIIFYAFDMDDDLSVHAHKRTAQGKYAAQNNQIIYNKNSILVSYSYRFKDNLLEITQKPIDGRSSTVITSYRRVK